MEFTFKNFEQLIDFLKEKDLRISDLKILIEDDNIENDSSTGAVVEESKKEDLTENDIQLKILSVTGNPSVIVESVKEGENILYVKEFSSIENACAMSKINLLEKEFFMGVCNENGDNHVNLLVEILNNGKTITKDLSFKVLTVEENQEEKILLNINNL